MVKPSSHKAGNVCRLTSHDFWTNSIVFLTNAKVLWWYFTTLSETNIAIENRPSEKGIYYFQPSIFRCKLAVSFREFKLQQKFLLECSQIIFKSYLLVWSIDFKGLAIFLDFRWFYLGGFEKSPFFQAWKSWMSRTFNYPWNTTADGRNPEPLYKTTYQLVQDFVHQQYYLENIGSTWKYHNFRQLWLVSAVKVKLMNTKSNLFSR